MVKFALSNAQYTELLGKINLSTTERREMLDTALRFAAFHAAAHRNADPALRLFAVIGRETNRQGMAKWLEANAPIGFKDGVAFFHEKKWKMFFATVSAVEVERELIDVLPFWRVVDKETEIKDTLDVAELLRSVVRQVEGQIKANDNPNSKKAKKSIIHGELLAELSALANKVEYASK